MSRHESTDQLIQAIVETCNRFGFSVETDPPELLHTETKSSRLLAAVTNPELVGKDRKKGELKDKRLSDLGVINLRGIFVRSHSHYAIQIGVLDDSLQVGEWAQDYRAKLMARWHAHQQLAAIARTWLATDFSDDLNLFLVGPAGSSTVTEWINFAQSVERNDLVCRKLVWLPSKNESMWGQEIAILLRRSFFAKPWERSSQASGVSLDSVSDISNTLNEWSEVLDDPAYANDDRDYDALITALLEKFRK